MHIIAYLKNNTTTGFVAYPNLVTNKEFTIFLDVLV